MGPNEMPRSAEQDASLEDKLALLKHAFIDLDLFPDVGRRVPRPSCAACGHAHVAGDATALSRFAGVTGYRTPDGEIHATREDAQQWLCKKRQEADRG